MANFIHTIGPPTANIMLVGEAPGEQEDRYGVPFVAGAPAGRTLRQLLDQAGINFNECLVANVARERPPGNKISFYFEDAKCTVPKPIMKDWVQLLKKEILQYKPNIVIALGATAMWALLNEKGIADVRGYICESTLVPEQKMIVAYHPQKVNYEWKLGFQTIMDLRKGAVESNTPEMPKDMRVLNSYPSFHEFMDYMNWLYNDHKDPIALDIEVTAYKYIDIIGIADSPSHAMSFTILNSNKTPRLPPDKEIEFWSAVARLLSKKEVIMHNGLYDLAVLFESNNILCSHFSYDTMVAAHCAWPESPRSLSFLSSICLNVPRWKHTVSTMPSMYNCADAANTYGVWDFLKVEMDKLGVIDTFKFEMMQVEPATMMQLRGVDVDRETQLNKIKEVRMRLEELDSELETAFGKKVNLNSYKQLQTMLYIDMKLPVQYKRRKSRYDNRKMTADAEALNKLARVSNNPLLYKILEYKKLDKLLGFLEIELSPKGRVHTSYNITGATMQRRYKGLVVDDEDAYKSFGRWSSSQSIILPYGSGNLQNIPHAARVMYRAPEGKLYLQADYVQAEAVVVAYCIGDEVMKDMFRKSFGMTPSERKEKKYDIHLITASNNFGVPIDEVTESQRDVGKAIRHATNYSAGPGVLAAKIGCSMGEAKDLLRRFHDSCPQLYLWHLSIQKELQQTRMLINLLGRKHRFLERWGDDLFRSAYSFIPQSTVGDLLNLSLVRIYNSFGEKVDVVLQLHDALYFIVDEDCIGEIIDIARECMLIPLSVNGEEFTIDVDFAAGPSWGELTKLDV